MQTDFRLCLGSDDDVDADGDQIMLSVTHNSQFTQSLLLFVSLAPLPKCSRKGLSRDRSLKHKPEHAILLTSLDSTHPWVHRFL